MSLNKAKTNYRFIVAVFLTISLGFYLYHRDIYLFSIFIFGGFNNLYLLLRPEYEEERKIHKKLNFLNLVNLFPKLINKLIPSENFIVFLFKRSLFPFVFTGLIAILYGSEVAPYNTLVGSLVMELIYTAYLKLRIKNHG